MRGTEELMSQRVIITDDDLRALTEKRRVIIAEEEQDRIYITVVQLDFSSTTAQAGSDNN